MKIPLPPSDPLLEHSLRLNEFVTLALFRDCSPQSQDDIRRFALAVWRQEHPTKRTNVIPFRPKIQAKV